MFSEKQFTPYEFQTRELEWQEESLLVLENAPRTYIDIVVLTPSKNKRILFKIIDGFKCDIFWNDLFIDSRKQFHRTTTSGFDSHSYKKLFEYYDVDNPPEFSSRLQKEGVIKNDDYTFHKYDYLYKTSWYHKSIVQGINSEVENMAINHSDMDFDSFKDYLNLENVNILDIESGLIVNEKLSAELEEKVQFALIISWLLSSSSYISSQNAFTLR